MVVGPRRDLSELPACLPSASVMLLTCCNMHNGTSGATQQSAAMERCMPQLPLIQPALMLVAVSLQQVEVSMDS